MYPPEEQAVFEAAWRILDNAMLVSECQDFIGVLKEHGFELVKVGEMQRLNDTNTVLRGLFTCVVSESINEKGIVG